MEDSVSLVIAESELSFIPLRKSRSGQVMQLGVDERAVNDHRKDQQTPVGPGASALGLGHSHVQLVTCNSVAICERRAC